jgi:hypothetical protein
MNPAGSLGPALVSGDLASLWIYVTARSWARRLRSVCRALPDATSRAREAQAFTFGYPG